MKQIIAVVVLAAAPFAIANAQDVQEDHGWYVGFGVGEAHINDKYEDTARKFTAGYQIDRIFGVEGQVGEIKDLDATVLTMAGTAGYPVTDRLRLYGKLGWLVSHFGDLDEDYRDQYSNTGNSLFAGVGATIAFPDNWHLVLEWEYLDDSGFPVGDPEVTISSASLQFRF